MIRIGKYSGLRKLAALVILSGVLSGCDTIFPRSQQDIGVDEKSRTIYALGRLEPAGGIISITGIPGAQLQQLDPDVKENHLVPANGVLGLLSGYEVGKAQLEALYAKKTLAEKKHEQDVQMVIAQKAQAEAAQAEAEAKKSALVLQQGKLELLEKASELATAEHRRMKELSDADPELVNKHDLAKKKNEMDLAIQDQKIAADKLKAAKDAVENAISVAQENVKVTVKSEELLQGGYDAEAINKEIGVAEVTLKRSILVWPNVERSKLPNVLAVKCKAEHEGEPSDLEGTDERPYTVLKVFLRPGESITQSPVVQLGDLREMVCVAEVYEADVYNIGIGQGVTIRSPSFSNDYADGKLNEETGRRSGGMRGTVLSKSQIVAPPGVKNRNPLAPADRNVVEVRIKIDDSKAVAHARSFVGMKVTVEFDKQDSAESKASDNDARQESPQEDL